MDLVADQRKGKQLFNDLNSYLHYNNILFVDLLHTTSYLKVAILKHYHSYQKRFENCLKNTANVCLTSIPCSEKNVQNK